VSLEFTTLDALVSSECEEIVFLNEPGSGLRAVLVIHDTSLGPAVGGVRFKRYDLVEDALAEARRLASAMRVSNLLPGYSAPENLNGVAHTVQSVLLESLNREASPYHVALEQATTRWRSARENRGP
jgi:hypothetical protein